MESSADGARGSEWWDSATKVGALTIHGSQLDVWKQRWFVLHQDQLFYFKKKLDSTPLGCISVEGSIVVPLNDTSRLFAFEVRDTKHHVTHHLQAESRKDMKAWISAIRLVAKCTLQCLSERVRVNDACDTGFEGLPAEWESALRCNGITARQFPPTWDAVDEVLRLLHNGSMYGCVQRMHWIHEEAGHRRIRARAKQGVACIGLADVAVVCSDATSQPQDMFSDALAHTGSYTYMATLASTSQSPFAGETVAITKVKREWDEALLAAGVDAMRKGCHDNIVEFIGAYVIGPDLWLVTEHMDNGCVADLFDYWPNILKALRYVHSMGIVHGEVTSDAVLLNGLGSIKLADYGHITMVRYLHRRGCVVGTPYWVPPEVIRGRGYSGAVDVWGVGIILAEMLNGEPPFMEYPPLRAVFLVATQGASPLRDQPAGKWSDDLASFCSQCLCLDSRCRPSADDLLEHPFLQRSCEGVDFTALLAQAKQVHDHHLFT